MRIRSINSSSSLNSHFGADDLEEIKLQLYNNRRGTDFLFAGKGVAQYNETTVSLDMRTEPLLQANLVKYFLIFDTLHISGAASEQHGIIENTINLQIGEVHNV